MPCSLNHLMENGFCGMAQETGFRHAGHECPQDVRCDFWTLEMESSIFIGSQRCAHCLTEIDITQPKWVKRGDAYYCDVECAVQALEKQNEPAWYCGAKEDRAMYCERMETRLTETQSWIRHICNEIGDILISKNRKYGDSAVNPKRVFSKANAIEQINVRLDDKISRIMSGQTDDDEDPELDLMGYLVLKRVAKAITATKEVEAV